MRTRALGIATLSLLSLAAPVFGQDAAEDPAALVRRARAAETIERDPAKAIELYRRVIATAVGTDAARDASLRLLELLEARGEKAAAIEVANALTERYTSRLDDEGKRRVHEALARLLPAGSKAKSPLGEVYVVPSGSGTTSPSSPLEAKVLAMLEKVDAQPQFRDSVLRDLALVGRDAMPILERALRTERLDRAHFAALALARIGGTGAIALLAKAVREGDGFTRSAALRGLGEIYATAESSPTVVVALDPLYADPALVDVQPLIRSILAGHLPDDQLLARHAAGGPDASVWLRTAVLRQNTEALKRVEEAARSGVALDRDLIKAFVDAAGAEVQGWADDTPAVQVRQPKLAESVRMRMLQAVAAQPPTAETVDAVRSIATALVYAGSTPTIDTTAAIAWKHVLAAEDGAARAAGVAGLLRGAVPFPESAAKDDAQVAAYVATWVPAVKNNAFASKYQRTVGFPTGLFRSARFWKGVAEIVPNTWNSQIRQTVLAHLALVAPVDETPREMDGEWLRLAKADLEAGRADAWTNWMAGAAARLGDPTLLDAFRTLAGRNTNYVDGFLFVVGDRYRGPGLSDFLVDLTASNVGGPQIARLVARERDSGAIWETFAARAEKGTDAQVWAIATTVQAHKGAWIPPKSFGPRWIAALRRTDLPVERRYWGVLAHWAAQSGSADFPVVVLDRLRPLTQGSNLVADHVAVHLVNALVDGYEAEGRLEAMRAIAQKDDVPSSLAAVVISRLAKKAPLGDPALVAALAARPESPAAASAVQALLGANEGRGVLLDIVRNAATAPLPPLDYALQLVEVVNFLHLVEATPWLLRIVKEGHGASEYASAAIEEIHQYHERIAKLEAYGRNASSPRQQIESHLADPEPTIRRGAVVALAALADRDALPRLLKIAKEDKDATVRKAALDAIDRIAGTPSPAPSAAMD